MTILIKNGRLVDPANKKDEVCDLLIDGQRVARIGKNLSVSAETVIDATERIILPGLVDLHVHLREPGREDKETIATGTQAAARGGVTTVVAMPNTAPCLDQPEVIARVRSIAGASALVNVLVCGAITRGRDGKELTDLSALKRAGAVAVSDDGNSVDDERLMRQALGKAKQEDLKVFCHCEDKALTNQGVMNLGYVSTVLGLRGISRESEYRRVDRDIRLAEEVGGAIHIAHVSCRESVGIIAAAKNRGVRVTAETAPHYFCLSEEAVVGYDTNMKMNPPLRSKEDREAIRAGLRDGVIDAIASDHAPHTDNEKDVEFDHAEFGVVGLQTQLSAVVTYLIETGILDWPAAVSMMSRNPSAILGLDKGILSAGAWADLVVVDPRQSWVVTKEALVSKSQNSAFLGQTLKGVVSWTICGGRIVHADPAADNKG